MQGFLKAVGAPGDARSEGEFLLELLAEAGAVTGGVTPPNPAGAGAAARDL